MVAANTGKERTNKNVVIKTVQQKRDLKTHVFVFMLFKMTKKFIDLKILEILVG